MLKNKLPGGIKSQLITIGVLLVAVILLNVAAGHTLFIERYYSNGLYVGICHVLHPLMNTFPFSVGDIVYILVVLWLIFALVQFIRLLIKRRFRQFLKLFLTLVIGIQATIVIFYLFWGLNYFRQPAAERLQLRDTSYTVADLKNVTLMMIDSANFYRTRVDTQDMQLDNAAIIRMATQAIDQMAPANNAFKVYKPRLKRSLISSLLNYLSTSGYYNPFTSEAQINYQMPVFIKPFVACHEISHQIGFAFEDEANFAGFIAGVRSHDNLLRYSAYYVGMQEFMHALHRQDSVTFKTLKPCIAPKVKHDLLTEFDYWRKYEGQISWLSSIFYNDYLKANNQPKGLATYNQMIRLAMALYKKQGHF